MSNNSDQVPQRYTIRTGGHPSDPTTSGEAHEIEFEDSEPIEIPAELLRQFESSDTCLPEGSEITVGNRRFHTVGVTKNGRMMNGKMRGATVLIPHSSIPTFTAGIGFDGMPTTIVQARRTTTKVVQAIPFVSSTSCAAASNSAPKSTSSVPKYQQQQQQQQQPQCIKGQWFLATSPVPPASTNQIRAMQNSVPTGMNQQQHPGPTTSSATPDSGIQSIPTSPPTPSFGASACPNQLQADDDFDDDNDFADMPILHPVDQEEPIQEMEEMPQTRRVYQNQVNPPQQVHQMHQMSRTNPMQQQQQQQHQSYSMHPQSQPSPHPPNQAPRIVFVNNMNMNNMNDNTPREFDSGREGGAGAEPIKSESSSVPTISLTSSMDSEEIVNRLIALDPEKASTIAMMIKKRTKPIIRKRRNSDQTDDRASPVESNDEDNDDMPGPSAPSTSLAVGNVEKVGEAEVSSTTPTTPQPPKRARTCAEHEITSSSSPSQETEVGRAVFVTSTNQEEPSSSAFEDQNLNMKVEEVKKEKSQRKGKKETKGSEGKKKVIVEDVGEIKNKVEKRQSRRKPATKKEKVIEEKEPPVKPATPEPNEDQLLQFRLAVQKTLNEAIEREIHNCSMEMESMKIQAHVPRNSAKKATKCTWTKLMSSARAKMKVLNPHYIAPGYKKPLTSSWFHLGVKKVGKSLENEESRKSRFSSRRSTARSDESPELAMPTEGRFNGEYSEVPRSFATSEDVFPLWRAPSLACGCIKGACTSDVECLNRALRVQCSSECQLNLCANKKFWREDTSRLYVTNGPKSKRCLKTRSSRRAGELLCEFVGEVVTSQVAIERFSISPDSRILAIGSNLFVDATKFGNAGRFVKHSCKPNSRLEVWSINGYYRAGIFTLYDIASNCEITIDKSGLMPLDVPCTYGCSENCKKIVRAAKNSIIASANAEILEDSEGQQRRFLNRNRRKTIQNSRVSSGLPKILIGGEEKCSTATSGMRKVFEAVAYRVRNIDGSIKLKYLRQYSAILRYLKTEAKPELKVFNEMMRNWLTLVDDDDIDRSYVPIQQKWLPNESDGISEEKEKEKEKERDRKNSTTRGRLLSNASQTSSVATCQSPTTSSIITKRSDADLSYLKTEWAIGSYDPDQNWDTYRAKAEDNAVRCVCGALDEDGEMVQCDDCHFWLHIDCVPVYDVNLDYICEFCNGNKKTGRPDEDVKLQTQPELRFEDCDYYKALVNRRGIQVRLNETVYVNKHVSDDHKVLLRNLKERCKKKKDSKDDKKAKFKFPNAPTEKIKSKVFERKDTRIFRVERLFVTPGNNRFVFGSFYAWPHETYIDTMRMFSKKEVFATPMYETLPLDEVIGRCMVIDSDTWRKGRPLVPLFKEDDIFLCEFQLKNQRCFEKVPPKNRYPINTQPYVFEKFSKPLEIVRNFRPYGMVPSTASPTSSAKNQKASKDLKDKKMLNKSAHRNLENIVERLIKLGK